MARPSRGEVFDPNEVAIAHVFNRTVRRCFLMGDDALSAIDMLCPRFRRCTHRTHRRFYLRRRARELFAAT